MTPWKIYQLTCTLGEHAPEWDGLNQRLVNGHPMLGSRFVNGLLKHFCDGTVYLCVMESGGTPAAMCLLQRGKLGIWQTFLPSQAQIGPVLMPDPCGLDDLMHSLPGLVTRLDWLCNDPDFGDLSTGNPATTVSQNHALTMCICLSGSFEDYWAARSKSLTTNMARYARRLATDQLESRFVCITAPEAVGVAVARYATLESKGRKNKLGTTINIKDSQGLFYTELMTQCAATGNAMVFELWFGEQMAASRLVTSSATMIIILKTTCDVAFNQYAPGRQLLKEVIQHLFNNHSGKTLEFYTHANADQLAWGTGQRWVKNISNYRSPWFANAFHLAKQVSGILASKGSAVPADRQPLTVSVYKHPDEFPPAVLQIFDAAAISNVECSAPWYRNLINGVFAGHDGVRFYVLLDPNGAVAALPILINKAALGNTVEALGNYYTTLYAPLLAKHAEAYHLVQLIDAIKVAHAPVTSMRFAPLDPEATGTGLLRTALAQSQLKPFDFFAFGDWYLRVEGNWDAYLKGRSGTLRSTIKRMMKKLTTDGGTLELIQGGADLERGLAAYDSVYAASWKVPEPYTQFMPGLIQACASQGWLRLGLVWLNGEAIAAQFWIVANGKASIYKVAYNENYKPYSPGTILSAMLMEHVIETDHVTKVDFLIGDDPYKKTWMSHRRERWGTIAYNPNTIGGLWGMAKEVIGRNLRSVIARFQKLELSKSK